MARGCIFCGKSPTTREHLVPKWVSAVLKQDHRGLDPRGGVEAEVLLRQTLIHRATWSNPNAIDFVANCVCASCNGGWMSVIENEAKLVLTPLIKGTWKTLDVPAQRTIANWLALKATIDLYASKVPVSIPRKFRRHLYESHTPPPTWQFALAYTWARSPLSSRLR